MSPLEFISISILLERPSELSRGIFFIVLKSLMGGAYSASIPFIDIIHILPLCSSIITGISISGGKAMLSSPSLAPPVRLHISSFLSFVHNQSLPSEPIVTVWIDVSVIPILERRFVTSYSKLLLFRSKIQTWSRVVHHRTFHWES